MSADQAKHEMTPEGWKQIGVGRKGWLSSFSPPTHDANLICGFKKDKIICSWLSDATIFRRNNITLFLPAGEKP